jgi:hypothetical protein
MAKHKTKKPRCFRCGEVIRDAEYLTEDQGARHMTCPCPGIIFITLDSPDRVVDVVDLLSGVFGEEI